MELNLVALSASHWVEPMAALMAMSRVVWKVCYWVVWRAVNLVSWLVHRWAVWTDIHWGCWRAELTVNSTVELTVGSKAGQLATPKVQMMVGCSDIVTAAQMVNSLADWMVFP